MSENRNSTSMKAKYFKFMFISPFTTWWGAFTFMLEVLAFILIGQSISFTRIELLILLFFVSFSLFVGFLVVIRGWSIYSNAYERIRITEIVKIEGEQVFLLKSYHTYKIGSLFEIYRIMAEVEIPIGIIEITHIKGDGTIQAKPIWILPIHMRDIELHELSIENLMVNSNFCSNNLLRWIDEQADRKVQELLKRGNE